MKKGIIVYLSCLGLFTGVGQLRAQTALDRYIGEGFENNIVLQRKHVSYDKALLGLKTARSLFLPSLDFQFAYQTASGGRQIPLPIGDMLNGVYSTLNQLTQTNAFPQIENQTIAFLPQNFYDAKVRTSVPLLNTDLIYNRQISEKQVSLQEFEVEAYKRELVKSIKTAYYNYLSSLKAVDIHTSSLELAREGKRVNEKLLASGKGLPAYVIRSNSEIASLSARISQARQQVANARLYFNALLNREGGAAIDTSYTLLPDLKEAEKQLAKASVESGREELKSLDQLIKINETVRKMRANFAVPKLNGFVDLGSQSENWRYDSRSRYFLAGVQLSVPIFEGNRNRQKMREAELDIQDTRLNLEHTRQQLDMSSNVALNNLRSAWETLTASREQLKAAETYQRLIEKGYGAGSNTYIETIDARNQLTSARLALSVNTYNVLQAAASLERETASYNLHK